MQSRELIRGLVVGAAMLSAGCEAPTTTTRADGEVLFELLTRSAASELVRLRPGDTLAIEEGWQAGHHVWASLLAEPGAVAPEIPVPVEFEITHAGVRVGHVAIFDTFSADPLGLVLFPQIVVLGPTVDPQSLDGAVVLVRGAVTVDGIEHATDIRVELRCCTVFAVEPPVEPVEVDPRGIIAVVEARPRVVEPNEWVDVNVVVLREYDDLQWAASEGAFVDRHAARTRWRSDVPGRHGLVATVEVDGQVDVRGVQVTVVARP